MEQAKHFHLYKLEVLYSKDGVLYEYPKTVYLCSEGPMSRENMLYILATEHPGYEYQPVTCDIKLSIYMGYTAYVVRNQSVQGS